MTSLKLHLALDLPQSASFVGLDPSPRLTGKQQKQVIAQTAPAQPRNHAWTPANHQGLPEHGETVDSAT